MNTLTQLDMFVVPVENLKRGTYHWTPCASCRTYGSEWQCDCAIAQSPVHGFNAVQRLCDRCVSRLMSGETLPWIRDGAGTGFTADIVIRDGRIVPIRRMHGVEMEAQA